MVDIICLMVALTSSINFDFLGSYESVVEDGASCFVSNALLVVEVVADVLVFAPIDSLSVVDRVALEEVATVALRPFSLGGGRAVSVDPVGAGKCCGTLLDCDWRKTSSLPRELLASVGFQELRISVCPAVGRPDCVAMLAHFTVCVEQARNRTSRPLKIWSLTCQIIRGTITVTQASKPAVG